MLLPKSTTEVLHVIQNDVVISKTYNNSNIEQLGVCTLKIRHKDKYVRCRFFVVPGDGGLELLVMTDIEVLDILRIM